MKTSGSRTSITGTLVFLAALMLPWNSLADGEQPPPSGKQSDCSPIINQIGW